MEWDGRRERYVRACNNPRVVMMLGHRPLAATGHCEQKCTLLLNPSARVQP